MQEAAKTDAVSQIQVLQSKSNVATSLAAVSNAEAALNTARTNLGYCTVRAPVRRNNQSQPCRCGKLYKRQCATCNLGYPFIKTIICIPILM